MAQVCFMERDLRRNTCFHALQWRRSPLVFHTCARSTPHLPQEHPAPAPLHFPVYLFDLKMLLINKMMVDECTFWCTRSKLVCCVSMS